MKRCILFVAVFAAAALLLPGQAAYAGVAGTAHSTTYTSAQAGDCSICHVPHTSPASAKRLWPAAPDTTAATTYGDIGALCYYCHSAAGGGAIGAANSDNTAFHISAHGVGSTSNPDGGSATTASGLPYATATEIECTSCHNPHEDAQRPFMVTVAGQTINNANLCAKCHPNRVNSGNDGSGSWSGYGAANVAGSHPVGSNVYDDLNQAGNSPINATALGIRGFGSVGAYLLGPKIITGATTLATGAGMTCVTCHSVHGVETADGGVPLSGTPNEDLLAVAGQGNMSGHANGGRSDTARNVLCESCHVNGLTPTYDPATSLTYAGTFEPNPGNTAYSHPADDLGARQDAGVGDWAATNWPARTNVTGKNTGTAPICESCHMPHPAASTVAQPTAPATVATGTHILRNSELEICGVCHTSAPPNHHPANVAMGRFTDAAIVPAGTTLLCGHCHQDTAAHNWGGIAQVGLNANWEPFNNARPHSAGQVDANMSKECVDCHLSSGIASPTLNAITTGDTVVRGTEYTDSGEGSHYLGVTTLAYASGVIGATTPGAFNALTTAWTRTDSGTGGYSLWGGTAAGTVVCESCHVLNPAWADNNAAMLLKFYAEGSQATTEQTRSQFCTACHGDTPGGGNPHPMTGATISKAVDAGRTTTTLITTPTSGAGASYANATGTYTIPGSWTGNSTYPADNKMNCDSCHQPHDTPTGAGTWIIDTLRANITGGVAAGNLSPGKTATPAAYQAFCTECHTY